MDENPLRQCPVCGGIGRLKFAQELDESKLTNKSFSSRKRPEFMHYDYFECVSCKSLFVAERPELSQLANNYSEAEFVSKEDSVFAAKTYIRELRKIGLASHDSLLDIGCSDGAFLEEVLAFGCTVVAGIEPSLKAIENACQSVENLIIRGTFEEAQVEGKFDLITCFQTIEHLRDIGGLFERVYHLLNPGGRLVMVCHNRNSLVNKLLGRRSPIFDIEHLQILTRMGARVLFEKRGFDDVSVKSISNRYPISYWLSLSPINKSMKDFIERRRIRRLLSWAISLRVGNLLVVGTKRWNA